MPMIIGRAHLYLGEKEISASEMTVTIISSRKPIKVLRHCPGDVRWEAAEVGHYVNTDILPVHLIVINELFVKEDNSAYIYYAYRIAPELTKEVLRMSGKSRSYQKNLEFIAKDIGKELIPFLSAEYIVRRLTPEERKKLKQLLEEEIEKDKGRC